MSERQRRPSHVVVVCLANQCRSPIGEFLLARKLAAAGRGDIEVTSAGLEATPGLPATRGARDAVARRFGADELKRHRATLLTPGLIASADFVLVMTRGQSALLHDEWAGVVDRVNEKVLTLGEFAGQPKVDVDDPVGGDAARYDACLALLDKLTTAAAKRLTSA